MIRAKMKFNRFLILFIIFFLMMLVWVGFSFYVANASGLRDFQDTAELEQFLELGIMVALRPASCESNVDTFIGTSSLNGYRVERFIITSADYYGYWYNAELPTGEAHGVALVSVAGKPWLIEPTIPMAWELNKPYAGIKVGISWQ